VYSSASTLRRAKQRLLGDAGVDPAEGAALLTWSFTERRASSIDLGNV
jgi:hypothetical protein